MLQGGTWPTCRVERATPLTIAGGAIPTGRGTASGLLTVPLGLERMPLEEEMVGSTWSATPVTTTQWTPGPEHSDMQWYKTSHCGSSSKGIWWFSWSKSWWWTPSKPSMVGVLASTLPEDHALPYIMWATSSSMASTYMTVSKEGMLISETLLAMKVGGLYRTVMGFPSSVGRIYGSTIALSLIAGMDLLMPSMDPQLSLYPTTTWPIMIKSCFWATAILTHRTRTCRWPSLLIILAKGWFRECQGKSVNKNIQIKSKTIKHIIFLNYHIKMDVVRILIISQSFSTKRLAICTASKFY